MNKQSNIAGALHRSSPRQLAGADAPETGALHIGAAQPTALPRAERAEQSTGGATAPFAPNPYTYDHVSFEDHSWIADEEFISDWGPYGLCDTDLGVRATTLRKLGTTTSRSLILDKPLCSGCDEVIVGNVCHNCQVVFHNDREPSDAEIAGWEKAERSCYGMGGGR